MKKKTWIILSIATAVLAVSVSAVLLNPYYISRPTEKVIGVDFSKVTKVYFYNENPSEYVTLEDDKLNEFLNTFDNIKFSKSTDQKHYVADGMEVVLFSGHNEIGSFSTFPTAIVFGGEKNKYIRYNSSAHFDYVQLKGKYFPASTQQS